MRPIALTVPEVRKAIKNKSLTVERPSQNMKVGEKLWVQESFGSDMHGFYFYWEDYDYKNQCSRRSKTFYDRKSGIKHGAYSRRPAQELSFGLHRLVAKVKKQTNTKIGTSLFELEVNEK